jgi:pectate lyase
MRNLRTPLRNRTLVCAVLSGLCGVASFGLIQSAQAQAGPFQNPPANLATQILAANDGWAATNGVTGGSAANPANIFTVTNWAQLKAALNNKSATPKIIQVSGTVLGSVDANNNPVPCSTYDVAPYTLAAYIASGSATTAPSAAQAAARTKSESNFAPHVQLQVGSNTTIVGLGSNATIQDVSLIIAPGVTNIILRNLEFADAIDCYPVWTPTDQNPQTPPYVAANNYLPGNFNSSQGNVEMEGKNWWIDHCTFTDAPDDGDSEPIFYGRPFQFHDGSLDIWSGADFGTVSWTIFTDHGKTNLVGASDSTTSDAGHLRTTFHHDIWSANEERAPRVRYGQVDVYNNFYSIDNPSYVYSWGAGVKSAIHAESNAFITGGPQANLPPNQIIYPWGGTVAESICVSDTRYNNPDAVVDVVSLVNAATRLWNPPAPALIPTCTWTPVLRIAPPDAAQDVPALVLSGAVALPAVGNAPAFPSTTVGNTSASSSDVTLTNNGAGILLINNVTATGDFSVGTNNCVTSLAPNSSCTVSVHFTPSAEGMRTGTLSFSDWAKSSPQTVNLSAPGIVSGSQQLVTTAVLSKISGGYQAVVTVTNNGSGTVQNVQLTSASLGAAGGTALPVSLGNISHGGGSATVTLTFPTSAGSDGAPVVEKLAGTYTGGTFGGSFRATLP